MSDTSTTWILLRGLGREKAHWGPFLERFQARFPNDEVLPIDLPGTGEHLKQTSPPTLKGILNYVRGEAIERAKGPGRFKIFAVSLGGMVAMEWLREKPEELAGCVLVNTSAASLNPVTERLRWQIWREFLKVLTVQSAREREKSVISLLFNNPEAAEAALPQWTKIAIERPVGYATFFNQLLAASRSKTPSPGGEVPVLLLSGLGDRFVDPACSTRLHEKLHWPIARHPWAGHDLTWDDPDWALDKTAAWKELANAKH